VWSRKLAPPCTDEVTVSCATLLALANSDFIRPGRSLTYVRLLPMKSTLYVGSAAVAQAPNNTINNVTWAAMLTSHARSFLGGGRI
jgi:hypothetical protein